MRKHVWQKNKSEENYSFHRTSSLRNIQLKKGGSLGKNEEFQHFLRN